MKKKELLNLIIFGIVFIIIALLIGYFAWQQFDRSRTKVNIVYNSKQLSNFDKDSEAYTKIKNLINLNQTDRFKVKKGEIVYRTTSMSLDSDVEIIEPETLVYLLIECKREDFEKILSNWEIDNWRNSRKSFLSKNEIDIVDWFDWRSITNMVIGEKLLRDQGSITVIYNKDQNSELMQIYICISNSDR